MHPPDWQRSLLACPRCKGELSPPSVDQSLDELHCPSCHLAYPIRQGVPELLVEEARPLRHSAD